RRHGHPRPVGRRRRRPRDPAGRRPDRRRHRGPGRRRGAAGRARPRAGVMARLGSGWMTAGLASRGRRLLSAAVAIIIGVGFLSASLVVLMTAKAGVENAVAASVKDADLVLSSEDEWLSTDV